MYYVSSFLPIDTPLNSSRSKSAVSDDLVRKSVHSAESTPRRLKLQIDKAIGDHRTSANMINAVVGGISTRGQLGNMKIGKIYNF